MINGTTVTIVGNVGNDPELRYTASGTPAASFSVAVQNRRFLRDGEYADRGVTWYRVNAWRDLAENAAASLQRGMRVIVTGSLESRDWESGDKSGTAWEITADAIGPELSFATATVNRVGRSAAPPADDPWSGRDVLPAGERPDNGQEPDSESGSGTPAGKTAGKPDGSGRSRTR